MPVDTLHTIYAVNIDVTGVGSDILITQVQNQSVDSGITLITERGDGSLYNSFVAVQGQSPIITFVTSMVKSALAKIGGVGLKIDAPGVNIFLQKKAQGGVRATGASHVKMTVTEGILIPTSLTVTHNTKAILTYTLISTFDGTNDPIIIATGQSLVGTPSAAELFDIGPAKINGASLIAIQSLTVDFGINANIQGGDGELFPTFSTIDTIDPTITLTTLDSLAFGTFTLSGAAQGATDSVIFLRKYSEGGTRVADAALEHVSFTVDEGIIHVTTVEGDDGTDVTTEVIIKPTFDGTNTPIVIGTDVAIV